MRQSTIWRTLLTSTITLSLAAHAATKPNTGHADTGVANAGGTTIPSRIHSGGLPPAEATRLAREADQRVVIILRDQHPALPTRSSLRAVRTQAIAADQRSIVAELWQVRAPRLHAFHLINAIAATVSQAEEMRLKTNPLVRAVVPDDIVRAPRQPSRIVRTSVTPATPPFIPACENTIETGPEALQLTNTAFDDASMPQAQGIVTGTGVTVAFLADGLDPNNTDFIRRDGTPVFTDYQDFSGDGPNAPTDGREAFGDASSIAAQGKAIYDVNTFVNVAHQRRDADCPKIRVLGMAPGASLVGLKVFGSLGIANSSTIAQAVEYAVDHHVDVINESLGGNPFPDNADDPLSLANDAAVRAGVTVVASSGDAGTATTISSPATDPNVIAAGASTSFRVYQQTHDGAIDLGTNGGYVSDNISGLSSSGAAQSGRQTVDVVVPGDLGWSLCSDNTFIYFGCMDDNGNPSRLQVFGGTSEAAPLTAGEAALVIQAYRQSHGGVSPTPELVKRIIKSTATDLNIPSDEQGAGLINSLKAVRATLSYQDANSTPTISAQGDALLVSPSTLSAAGNPGTPEKFAVEVTNSGASVQTIQGIVRTLGAPAYRQSFIAQLDAAATTTFTDTQGFPEPYVTQDFSVPANADRLDAAFSYQVQSSAGAPPSTAYVKLSLFDPQGRLIANSSSQGYGGPAASSGYGHVDVRNPRAGTYRAVIYTFSSTAFGGAFSTYSYSGPVRLDVSTSNFVTAGSVSPAPGTSDTLNPGQSGVFFIVTTIASSPGDESAETIISGTNTAAGAIPIILRALVPTPAADSATVFTGTLTGGNGRSGAPGQTLTYAFDVSVGVKDLDLGVAITDTAYNLEGVLATPDGQPIDVQSTVISATDPFGAFVSPPSNNVVTTAYTNTLQIFRRDPQPGRWLFVLFINDSVSGRQTSLPFTATLRFNGVRVDASGVPNDTGITLAHGTSAQVPVTVTNTGNTTKDFFVDPRLAAYTRFSLGGYGTSIPPAPGDLLPLFFVPTESNLLNVSSKSASPTVPIELDLSNVNGAPPYGATTSPEIRGRAFLDPFTGFYAAVASSRAAEVVPGLWSATPSEIEPYSDAGPTKTIVTTAAIVNTRDFDTAVDSSTGDYYALAVGKPSSSYAPLTLAPGQTGIITVTIAPTATVGSMISGILYVDTFNSITNSGDELVGLPYKYTVSTAAPTLPGTATASGTATVSGTATTSATATISATGTASAPATVSGTTMVSPTATVSATTTGTTTPPTTTGTAVPATSTGTAVPATSTGTAVPATSTSTAVPSTATLALSWSVAGAGHAPIPRAAARAGATPAGAVVGPTSRARGRGGPDAASRSTPEGCCSSPRTGRKAWRSTATPAARKASANGPAASAVT